MLSRKVGTAALLNVPASLEKVLKEMKAKGYDLGEAGDNIDGEALVAALKACSVHGGKGQKQGEAGHTHVFHTFVVRPWTTGVQDKTEGCYATSRQMLQALC